VKSRRVAIVGAALSDCGRVPDKTALQLIHQASSRAVADAGIDKHDVQGLGAHGVTLAPVEISESLGLRPTWFDGTNVGGSSWEVQAQHAAAAIAAGEVDVVLLAYGSTARSDAKRQARAAATAVNRGGPLAFELPYGHTLIAKYAMVARRHLHHYGTTVEQLAEIAVAAHEWALRNPEAFDRRAISVEDVASAPMIADPFTALHCCLRTDGGGAVVLMSEDRARDLDVEPIWILGAAHEASHVNMASWPDLTESPCARTGPAAFARAGIEPDDIDVALLYDSFTSTLLLTLEGLGFCGVGEGGSFVASGAIRPGGSLPVNPDGGGLAACHPGMRGIFLLVEAVRQLRGEAGERQVPGAHLACVNATGGFFSAVSTMVLGRD
jgi:acetyl-CoA acetyltransferase